MKKFGVTFGNAGRTSARINWQLKFAIICAVCIAFNVVHGCRSESSDSYSDNTESGIIVVTAPASGTVRRVFTGEGVSVNESAPLFEIAVQESSAITKPNAGWTAAAREQAQTARRQTDRLQAEVERAAVEVQRIGSLVATGAAPQPQLDAARAEYQKAQERLQQAQSGAQNAQDRLTAQRGGIITSSADQASSAEQIVTVRAPITGDVRVISVRTGQRITKEQPLATISTNKR